MKYLLVHAGIITIRVGFLMCGALSVLMNRMWVQALI
ncbi:MAG: hypothetical protein H6Q53_1827 [Deltaproteobacteria bacterium]|nr:hypothetical protein [Deltaproteobacteria bacterium]